jgi:hypothetical protein
MPVDCHLNDGATKQVIYVKERLAKRIAARHIRPRKDHNSVPCLNEDMINFLPPWTVP